MIGSQNFEEAIIWYNKAFELSKNKAFDEAIESFEKAVMSDPNFIDAWFGLGYVHDIKKDYDDAIMCFQEALKLDPGNEAIKKNLAYVFSSLVFISQNAEKDEEWFEELLQQDLRDYNTWFKLGSYSSSQGRFDEAIKCYQSCIELEMGNEVCAIAWDQMGTIFRRKKSYHMANECYIKAHSLFPEQFEEKNVGSEIRSDEKEEINHLLRELNFNFDESNRLNEIGQEYSEKKELGKAIEYFKKRHKLYPKILGILHILGRRYLTILDYDKAIEAFRDIIEIRTDILLTWNKMASTFIKRNE